MCPNDARTEKLRAVASDLVRNIGGHPESPVAPTAYPHANGHPKRDHVAHEGLRKAHSRIEISENDECGVGKDDGLNRVAVDQFGDANVQCSMECGKRSRERIEIPVFRERLSKLSERFGGVIKAVQYADRTLRRHHEIRESKDVGKYDRRLFVHAISLRQVWIAAQIQVHHVRLSGSTLQDVASSNSNIRNPRDLAALLKDLGGEIDQLLVAEGIVAVDSYGWMDHDEADPEYIGFTLWQTDPPFQPDYSILTGGGIVSYAPTRRDEVLIRNGEDFVAVMNAARRSMGNALVKWRVIGSEVISTSDEFWEDYSICTMLLAIASDRMRDFLVMALEDVEYDSRKSESDQGPVIKRAIDKVPGLAKFAMQSQKYKAVRNEIVHEIATLAARRSVNSLREQRMHAISGYPVEIWEPTFEELQTLQTAIGEARKGPPSNAEVQQMKLWYQCLIEASNLIFKAEHSNRRRV